jgi:hypothetical protein
MVLGVYEPDIQRQIAEHVRGSKVAYDLGTHVGFMSLLLGKLLAPG